MSRQNNAPGPFVGPISGGGGGSGTPNVGISGTDALGNPIAGPVLAGDLTTKNVKMVVAAPNENTFATATDPVTDNLVTGTNNDVKGKSNAVSGDGNLLTQSYDMSNNDNVVGGVSNSLIESSNKNITGGTSNVLHNATNDLVVGSGNISQSDTSAIIAGTTNTSQNGSNFLLVGTLNDVSTPDNSIVAGNHNSGNMNNSIVAGERNNSGSNNCLIVGQDILDNTGSLSVILGNGHHVGGGSGCVVTGDRHAVMGNYNHAEGGLHVVIGDFAHTQGLSNSSLGKLSDNGGEGNTAKFCQTVRGRFAEIDPVLSTTVPIAGQLVENVGWGTDDTHRKTIRSLDDAGNLDVLASYEVASTKVVGPRELGWVSPTGVGSKGTFATSTVSLESLAEHVKSLTDALLTHGLLGVSPPSPLLTNYTYILPSNGVLDAFAASGAEESYKIRLAPTGPATTFQSVKIGFANTGAAYTVNRVYLMRSGNANTTITENPATGVVTVSAAPFVVPAGTDENPSWYWTTSTVVGPVSEFVALVDLATASARTDWGDTSFPGLGWLVDGDEKLNNNLTGGIDFTGSNSFGSLPPIAVKFEALTTSVLWLPFVGDSWIYGYGDGGGPWRPYGFEGRLNVRWSAASQPISVMGFGRTGFTTAQSVVRLNNLLANFDCRTAVVQFNSLNNVIGLLPPAQCRTDWGVAEGLMGVRKLLPFVGGGAPDAIDPGWFVDWKLNSDWMVARNAETNVNVYTTLVSPTTGVIGVGLSYVDDAHPNTAGYDAWELDSYTQMRAVIAGWGV